MLFVIPDTLYPDVSAESELTQVKLGESVVAVNINCYYSTSIVECSMSNKRRSKLSRTVKPQFGI